MKSSIAARGVVTVAIAGFLGACVQSTAPEAPAPDLRLRSEVSNMLGEAAADAAKAQETLARVQISRTKPAPLPLDESSLPAELKRPATIDWSGPAHEAARKISQMVGYDFHIVGNPPSIPPMIHFNLVDVPAAKALEQIGLQAYPFGEVAVDPNVKRVEFRYIQAQTGQHPKSASGISPAFGAHK